MTITFLAPSQYNTMPWKNGGGVTRELAVDPTSGADFAWGVSMAEVSASGPFSDFTGYDRAILVLRGRGFTLTFSDGSEKIIDQALRPFVFDGAEKPTCRLHGGPITDFNLMVSRDRARGVLEVTHAGNDEALAVSATSLIYVVSGALQCDGRVVTTEHALRLDNEPAAAVLATADSILIVARIFLAADPGTVRK